MKTAVKPYYKILTSEEVDAFNKLRDGQPEIHSAVDAWFSPQMKELDPHVTRLYSIFFQHEASRNPLSMLKLGLGVGMEWGAELLKKAD